MEAPLGSVFNYMYVQIMVPEGRKGAKIGGMSNLCKGTSEDIEKKLKSIQPKKLKLFESTVRAY